MTQVQLTDQQLNRALAKLMGYTVIQSHDEKEGGGAPLYQLTGLGFAGKYDRKPENTWKSVPNWSSDPAASLEVQAAAYTKNPKSYMRNLSIVMTLLAGPTIKLEEVGQFFFASPRERAEAAYITLQGAKGNE